MNTITFPWMRVMLICSVVQIPAVYAVAFIDSLSKEPNGYPLYCATFAISIILTYCILLIRRSRNRYIFTNLSVIKIITISIIVSSIVATVVIGGLILIGH